MPGQSSSGVPQGIPLHGSPLSYGLINMGQALAQAGAPSPYKQSFAGGLGQAGAGFAQGAQQYQQIQREQDLYELQRQEAEQQKKKFELDAKKAQREEADAAAYEAGARSLPPPPGVDPAQWASVPAKQKFDLWTKHQEQQMNPADVDEFALWVEDYRKKHGTNPTMADIVAYRQAGRPQASTTIYNQDYGNIPPGYRLVQSPEGVSMERVPGSPADESAQINAATRQQTADIVVEDIDRAIGIMDSADFVPVTGLVGSQLAKVPGTDAHNLQQLLVGLRSNTSFDKLQAMRAASPTGGALGPVSDIENKKLESAMGSLEQSQDDKQLRENLARVKRIYLEIIHGPSVVRQQQPPAEPQGPTVNWIWKDGKLVPGE